MGTPMYMSPEQVEGKPLDPRSDIYSLGVTCYQMLAGRPPFEGETPLAIAVQHLKNEPERLEVRRPDLPVGLCRVVHKMLAKKPADRYQRAGELLRELRSLQIEGTGEEWPDDLEEWSTAEFMAMANARTQATRQLDKVMKTEAGQRGLGWRIWPILLGLVLVAFGLGCGWAWLKQERPLLEIHDRGPSTIERKKSAREQLYHAIFLNTEQAYQSVWEYFPPEQSPENRLESWKAKRRLGELYLRDGDLDRALGAFTDLAELDEGEEPYRTLGLAGQSIVYGRRQNRAQLAKTLPQLYNKQQHLDDAMRSEIERLIREYEQPGNGPTGNGGGT
jgi:serine/threonine-protein kinase